MPMTDRDALARLTQALDAYFEAKCKMYLKEGDLFWIIGITQAQQKS